MAFKINLSKFDELLQIQKERQLAMKEASEALGIDISFSDDEVMKFALEEYQKQIEQQINKEVEGWMKSLFS
jgi:DNA-binding ferritin-like protein (Dps family)